MAEGGNHSNKDNWDTFLGSLTTTRHGERVSGLRLNTEDVNNNPLVGSFIKKLELQKRELEDEQKRKIKNSLTSTLLKVFERLESDSLTITGISTLVDGIMIEIRKPTNSLLNDFEEYFQIVSQKPDLDMTKSGSTWTLDMLAKYFSLDHDKFYAKQPVQYNDDWEPQQNTSLEARKEIHDILVTFGVTVGEIIPSSTGLCHLNSSKECIVRTILDSLLKSICRQAREEASIEIQLCLELSMERQGLPKNIFDYVLIKNSYAVGIVETKKHGKMNKKAVTQLVLQLMSLLSTTKPGDPKSTCFGVLTDGYRFLFAYANKDGIFFESKVRDNGNVTILEDVADTWEDFDLIRIKILNLCRLGVEDFHLSSPSTSGGNYVRATPFTSDISMPAIEQLSI